MPNPTSKLNLVINGATTQLDIHDANAVDLSSNQTVGGDKEFIGTTTAHDLVPSATDTYNFGSSSVQWNNAYIKSLTINGVACGDILTHNASEFVDLSNNQTIGGSKTFSNEVTMFGRDINLMSRLHYGKNSNPSTSTWQYLFFRGNTAAEGYTDSWYSGFLEQFLDNNGSTRGRWLVRDTSESPVALELFVSGDNKQVRPMQNNTTDLGTSANKWKSFNGINPGALSLPNVNDGVVAVDTTNFTWNTNWIYTPLFDGWVSVWVQTSSATGRRFAVSHGYLRYWYSIPSGEIFRFSFPVIKNVSVYFAFTSDIEETVAPTIYLLKARGSV